MSNAIKIAIPMAGLGTRMRPHTWSKPKPLIGLAGKTVLDHLLEQFNTLPEIQEAEFVFIIGSNQLEQIQAHMQQHYPHIKVDYVLQEKMRGQSDALYLAREYLTGPMLMCFSDTLIETDLSALAKERVDGIAWVKRVADPRRFGVAEVDQSGRIKHLIEKPKNMDNNLALVGFYYFSQGKKLMEAIQTQFERQISQHKEFFLADAVNIMLEGGAHFRSQVVETWLDAGKTDALLETNQYLLSHGHDNNKSVPEKNGVSIIPPVNIHADIEINNSVIGPFVSIAKGCHIDHVIVKNSIIEENVKINHRILENSILGRNVQIEGHSEILNLGDDACLSK